METNRAAAGRAGAASSPGAWGLNLQSGDAEVVAAVLALKDTQKTRQEARARREAAQTDRIALYQAQADKLRSMAGNAIWSGVYQAAVGLASSAVSLAKGLNDIEVGKAERALGLKQQGLGLAKAGGHADVVSGLERQVADRTKALADLQLGSACSEAAGRLLSGAAQVDPLRTASQGLEADRAQQQVEIERSSQRADAAAEALSEANRQQGSLMGLMQRAGELRAQAEAAALR